MTDHDFSKLSNIPDAYLSHEIPEKDELSDEKVMMICSIKAHVLESGILGKSFTGSIKLMVSEGSSAMRYAAEIADVMTEHFDKTPPCLYVYSDGGPEKRADNLYKNRISPISSAQF